MISIHALLAESDLKFTRLFYDLFISIHALLAESDVLEEDFPVDSVTISIHALLAESDQAGIADVTQRLISIHALLAESDVGDTPPCCGCMISIHALLAESDNWPRVMVSPTLYFYPRSPCGERHGAGASRDPARDFYPRSPCGERQVVIPAPAIVIPISIHALLAESDDGMQSVAFCYFDFYPRSPCGERLLGAVTSPAVMRFLSTLSLRRATCSAGTTATSAAIFLSTLSLRRATLLVRYNGKRPVYFYPRSPCGERP